MSKNKAEIKDLGDGGKVRYLEPSDFDRDRRPRKFSFRFKITDIEGGPILPLEPNVRLIPDQPRHVQSPVHVRLFNWVGNFFGSSKETPSQVDQHDELTKALIKRILEKRNLNHE